MNTLTFYRWVGRHLLLCLLFSFSCFFESIAQTNCPSYPRAMDQVYVCHTKEVIDLGTGEEHFHDLGFDQNATLHNPVRFTFPVLPADITLSFDAGDGNGFSVVSSEEIKNISYSAPGQFVLAWRIDYFDPTFGLKTKTGTYTFQTNFNNVDANYNDFLPHNTWRTLVGNTYTPPASNAYPAGHPNNNPVNAGGVVHILYANPDHLMRKPFIFVEGFDPIVEANDKYVINDPSGAVLGYGSVRWDVLMTGRRESFDVNPAEPGVPHNSQFELFPSLIAGLRSRGYDIIYVDFADAGTYVQANSEFLIDVIEEVNAEKNGDEKIVLMGASMGGIIGRYALAKMEKEGKTHCVGLFGTVDSPHNGANIPLSLQAFSWFFHKTGTSANSQKAWKALDSPAARQMLLQHLGEEVQAGKVDILNVGHSHVEPLDFSELTGSDYGALREGFLSDFASVGWPQQPRKIAMLDGMKNGTLPNSHGYSPGGVFYNASGYANAADFGTVFKLLMRASNGAPANENDGYTVWYADNCFKSSIQPAPDRTLFSAAKPSDMNPCFGSQVPYKYHSIHLESNSDLLWLDNAPGGIRLDMREVNNEIRKEILGQDNVTFNNPAYFPISTFVPTWSSLAMGTALNNTNLFVDLTAAEFAEANLPNVKVPNFDNFYAPATNLRHVELDGGMVAFIFGELDRLQAAQEPGQLTETYNYGLKYKEIPNTIVTSTGVLNINNTGATGYVQSAPEGNAVKPVFTTYLNSCGQNITVEAGGQFNIGAMNKSQHGRTEAWDGSTIHIKSGGVLRVTSDQSELLIKHGAQLIIDAGAIIRLDAPGSRIHIKGDLVINGNFTFGGLGYFDFDEGNQLVFGPGYNNFTLVGAGKDQRFVRLSADVNVNQMHRLTWSNGLLEVGEGTLFLSEGAGVLFSHMTIEGGGQGTSAIDGFETGNMTFRHCIMKNLGEVIRGESGLGCTIEDCEFLENSIWGVYWKGAFATTIKRTSFDGGNAPSLAILMENMGFLMMEDCQVFDYVSGGGGGAPDFNFDQALPAIQLDNVVACMVKGCTVTGNTVGISASNPNTGATGNVYAYGGSIFESNGAAIYVVGDQTQGTVLADCVVFDRNTHSILGRDITLMIDSWNSKTFAFDTDSPNRFIRDNIPQGGITMSHVRICYEQKAVGGSNLMRNNFWGIHTGGTPATDPTPQNIIFLQNATCNAPVSNSIRFPNGSKDPICYSYELSGDFNNAYPGSECTVSYGSEVQVIHAQFHQGTYLMRNDDMEGGIDAMRPVAALWQSDLSSYPLNCQQYIRVAKAFVEAGDENLPGLPRNNAGFEKRATSSNLSIVPNPTDNATMIQLTEQEHQVRVWDIQGRICMQTNAAGSLRLETGDWQPGIYLIETINAEGIRKTGKLVVQH